MTVPDPISVAVPETIEQWGELMERLHTVLDPSLPAYWAIGFATVFTDPSTGESKIIDVRFKNDVINKRGENQDVAVLLSWLVGPLKTGFHFLDNSTYPLAPLLSWLSCFTEYDETDPPWDNPSTKALKARVDASKHPNFAAMRWILDVVEKSPVSKVPNHSVVPVVVSINDLDDQPVSTADMWLRLHLLSLGHAKPYAVNLTGVFDLLNINAWFEGYAYDGATWDATREYLLAQGRPVHAYVLDRFPHLIDYVTPKGVRFVHSATARLGAYLGGGTVLMAAAFVNFSAGTEGPNMVEGRVSAGVWVNAGSDIGGGASIMGTLSGGGKQVIVVGDRTLLGANAGVGIVLGAQCVVEAGLYVTAGQPVFVLRADGWPNNEVMRELTHGLSSPHAHVTVKAEELSGVPGLLFRRNSTSGAIEVLPSHSVDWKGLNADLHAN